MNKNYNYYVCDSLLEDSSDLAKTITEAVSAGFRFFYKIPDTYSDSFGFVFSRNELKENEVQIVFDVLLGEFKD